MKISLKDHRFSNPSKEDKQDIMLQSVSGFKRYDVDNLETLYLLLNDNVVYSSIFWKYNYRNKKNAILKNIDLIIFDCDDGETIDTIEKKLNCEALILQTLSWTVEKEKYRIFVPLDKPITFSSNEEYSDFYRWLASYFDLNYDKSTAEAGRAFIAVENKGAYLINQPRINPIENWEIQKEKIAKRKRREQLRRHFKMQEKSATSNHKIPTPNQVITEKKFKEIALECRPGNHYFPVFKLLSYCKFRGMDAESSALAVLQLNLGNEYSNKNNLIKKFKWLEN